MIVIQQKEENFESIADSAIDARNKAEEQFRTQFLSRMQENINEAKASIKELNKALKGIEFNHEMYEFTYSPKGKYEAIYRMIMDENNTNEGRSLFSDDFAQTFELDTAKIDEDDPNSQNLIDKIAVFDKSDESKYFRMYVGSTTLEDFNVVFLNSLYPLK